MFGAGALLERITSTLWGWGFLYYLGAGVSFPGVSALNDHLTNYGYPAVPEAYVSHLKGWRLFVKGYALSHFSGGIWGGSATYGDRIVSIDGDYYYYSLGRMLTLRNKVLYLIPSIGLGRSSLVLTVGDNVVKFDSLLSSPGQISYLETRPWVLTPEVELIWRKESFLFIGGRLGYMLAFPKGNWSTEGIGVREGPPSSLEGPYFNLVIGLGFVML